MNSVSQHSINLKSNNTLSAEVIKPEVTKAVYVFAHGAGAGMNHAFMKSLSDELATKGIATLRYNFLYVEQGKKRPDFPVVAQQAVAAAIDKTRQLFPNVPIFARGKSFGGRMTSKYLSALSE
ncbi:MAG: alpha/beta family hydrolase [Cytophagales bacterium]|nr:alpha/beta family hydrolase [Cytophagales bacterium]